MSELQPEAGLLAREPEILGGRPDRSDLVGGDAGPDELDRAVEPLAALLVGIELGRVAPPTQNVR